jgi:hypothetical protein
MAIFGPNLPQYQVKFILKLSLTEAVLQEIQRLYRRCDFRNATFSKTLKLDHMVQIGFSYRSGKFDSGPVSRVQYNLDDRTFHAYVEPKKLASDSIEELQWIVAHIVDGMHWEVEANIPPKLIEEGRKQLEKERLNDPDNPRNQR